MLGFRVDPLQRIQRLSDFFIGIFKQVLVVIFIWPTLLRAHRCLHLLIVVNDPIRYFVLFDHGGRQTRIPRLFRRLQLNWLVWTVVVLRSNFWRVSSRPHFRCSLHIREESRFRVILDFLWNRRDSSGKLVWVWRKTDLTDIHCTFIFLQYLQPILFFFNGKIWGLLA